MTDSGTQSGLSPKGHGLTPAQADERAASAEWTDYVLSKVRQLDGGSWECCADGTCWVLDGGHGVTPKVGDTIRLYGGWGRPIVGQDINGAPIYYRTKAEEQARHEQWVADLHARNRAEYEADKERLDAELAALPDPFRKRIERALAEDPDWAWQSMGQRYEQFCLVEAVKIHDHFKGDADAIQAWRQDRDYERQKKRGPKSLSDDHSGNTFGAAGYMAEALARGLDV